MRPSNIWIGIAATAVLSFCTLSARADYLQVSRRATVKAEPRIDAEVLYRLDRGDYLALLEDEQTNAYYHVELPDRTREGWISRYLVRRFSGEVPGDRQAHSGVLEVHVIDVGQADAIFVRCPDGNHEMLIDSGDNRYAGSGRQFKAYLSEHQSVGNEIEVVVATHPHADHIGNMAWVLDTYRVGLYVDNGNIYDSRTYDRVERAFERSRPRYWSAQDAIVPVIDFCPMLEVSAVVLRPEGFGEDSDPNNNSVVVRLEYADDTFLFVGDAEEDEEELLSADAATRALLDCDFLKVGHHGSATSSTEAFLALVTPDVAAISCGAKGVSTNANYKHPRREKIAALLTHARSRDSSSVSMEAFDSLSQRWQRIILDRAVYVTTAERDLVFESDGHGIRKR